MTAFRIRFEGSSLLALQVATALADADGLELKASQPPTLLADGVSALELTVEGDADSVLDAVAAVRGDLPAEASIAIVDG